MEENVLHYRICVQKSWAIPQLFILYIKTNIYIKMFHMYKYCSKTLEEHFENTSDLTG